MRDLQALAAELRGPVSRTPVAGPPLPMPSDEVNDEDWSRWEEEELVVDSEGGLLSGDETAPHEEGEGGGDESYSDSDSDSDDGDEGGGAGDRVAVATPVHKAPEWLLGKKHSPASTTISRWAVPQTTTGERGQDGRGRSEMDQGERGRALKNRGAVEREEKARVHPRK